MYFSWTLVVHSPLTLPSVVSGSVTPIACALFRWLMFVTAGTGLPTAGEWLSLQSVLSANAAVIAIVLIQLLRTTPHDFQYLVVPSSLCSSQKVPYNRTSENSRGGRATSRSHTEELDRVHRYSGRNFRLGSAAIISTQRVALAAPRPNACVTEVRTGLHFTTPRSWSRLLDYTR